METEVAIRLGTDVCCGPQYCCKHTEKAGWTAVGFLACKVALIFLFRVKHRETFTPSSCILDRLGRPLFKGRQKMLSCTLWVLRDVGQLCWMGYIARVILLLLAIYLRLLGTFCIKIVFSP